MNRTFPQTRRRPAGYRPQAEVLEDRTLLSAGLIRDINRTAASSRPLNVTNVGGVVFFIADGAQGNELWRSDGTEAGTTFVKDIRPGRGGSSPRELTNVNGTLFFWADDGVHG